MKQEIAGTWINFDAEITKENIEIANSYKGLNCTNCKYSSLQEDGSALCSKMLQGDTLKIDSSKVTTDCPCHSEYNRLETRCDRDNKRLFEADDVCKECHRISKELDKRVCPICSSKVSNKSTNDDGGKS